MPQSRRLEKRSSSRDPRGSDFDESGAGRKTPGLTIAGRRSQAGGFDGVRLPGIKGWPGRIDQFGQRLSPIGTGQRPVNTIPAGISVRGVADRRYGVDPLGRGDIEMGADGGGTEKSTDPAGRQAQGGGLQIRASPM